MSWTASFQRVWETLRCSIYDHKNEQLLIFHIITPQIITPQIITPQISTWKAPSRFPKSCNVKYFKVIKPVKSFQKAEAYLEPKRASVMELFREYT